MQKSPSNEVLKFYTIFNQKNGTVYHTNLDIYLELCEDWSLENKCPKKDKILTRDMAIIYCNNLKLAEKKWRLPDSEEAFQLSIGKGFHEMSNYYNVNTNYWVLTNYVKDRKYGLVFQVYEPGSGFIPEDDFVYYRNKNIQTNFICISSQKESIIKKTDLTWPYEAK
ncbi:MAG: hypothetical protein JJT78_00570 [Leptospira sp.]|nr:hypothetical protein [Leptospira sp.]